MDENRINEIALDEIHKVVENRVPLLEMETFGVERWGHTFYKIAVHGASTTDRPIPHFHIYLNNDANPYLQFNFAISLINNEHLFGILRTITYQQKAINATGSERYHSNE